MQTRSLTNQRCHWLGPTLCVLLTWPSAVWAQLPQIRLHSVFPTGGQVGTDVEVVVTSGVDLDDVSRLLFSNPGVVAVPKTVESDAAQSTVANTFTVTISSQASPGLCDLRVAGRYGISNPRSFEVGTRKETQEVEPNDVLAQATPIEISTVVNARSNTQADVDMYKFQGRKGQRVIVVCRAAAIDSRMLAVMEAYDAHGHRLATGRSATGPDPLMDLTLPADGDYYLKVFDAVFRGGNEYVYRLQLHTEAHIDFVIPAAGLAGSSETYMLFGRNLPGSTPAEIATDGCPLEKLAVPITLPADDSLLQSGQNVPSYQAGSDQVDYVLQSHGGRSNEVPIHFASNPVIRETEPNDSRDRAQQIDVPVEITGQFETVGDIDYFEFAATAGEVFWIDVFGQRDGSGADPYLTLEQISEDEDGHETGAKQLVAQDDTTTDLFPEHFSTLSDDVTIPLTVPAAGRYRISLRDRYFESRGDPRLVYRLVIRRERPDFRLVVVPLAPLNGQNNNTASPWPVGLRRGDNFVAKVLAFRRDGFSGPIAVEADGLPRGVSCQQAVLEAGQTQTSLVFTSTPEADAAVATIRVTGRAEIAATKDVGTDGSKVREITRTARPGTIVWEATPAQPASARVARELGLCVIDELAPLQVVIDATRIEVNRGRQILIPTKLLKRNGFDNNVTLTWEGQPPNLQVETKPINAGTTEGLQRIFVLPNAPLGSYTLVLKGQAQVSYTRGVTVEKPAAEGAPAAKPQNLNVVAPSQPLVLLIKEHPATLAVTMVGDAAIQRGGSISIPVTVNRVNGFAGPVILSLPLPPNVTGLSAESVTIAAEQKEGSLQVVAAQDATEGVLDNMVVRATMQFQGEAAIDQPISLKVVP